MCGLSSNIANSKRLQMRSSLQYFYNYIYRKDYYFVLNTLFVVIIIIFQIHIERHCNFHWCKENKYNNTRSRSYTLIRFHRKIIQQFHLRAIVNHYDTTVRQLSFVFYSRYNVCQTRVLDLQHDLPKSYTIPCFADRIIVE